MLLVGDIFPLYLSETVSIMTESQQANFPYLTVFRHTAVSILTLTSTQPAIDNDMASIYPSDRLAMV